MIVAIDLCCGAGGWAVAARGLPIRIDLAVDWWEPACMTYRINHPDSKVLRADLRNPPFDAASMRGKVDLVLGGIPCEWLSVYRNLSKPGRVRNAELEEQRALLDSVLAMVRAINPRWWCLEDVTGLVKQLPPLTPWHEINSRHYSPQRRKRVYVGDFPPPRKMAAAEHQKLRDALRPGPYRVGKRLFGRVPATGGFSSTNCLAAYADQKAPTVCVYSSRRDAELGVVDERLPGGLRQLEWQEHARLQGYPEDYLFWGSPTDVGAMVGRSVQIDTGRAILQSIVADAVKGKIV